VKSAFLTNLRAEYVKQKILLTSSFSKSSSVSNTWHGILSGLKDLLKSQHIVIFNDWKTRALQASQLMVDPEPKPKCELQSTAELSSGRRQISRDLQPHTAGER